MVCRMAVILTFAMIFDSFWLQRYKNIFRYQNGLLLFLILHYDLRTKEQAGGESVGKEKEGKKEDVEDGGLLLFWVLCCVD